MNSLNEDVQIEILSYLNLSEIITFYDCFSKIIDSLAIHPGFVIQCKEIIPQDQVNWFQKHKIQLKLLEKYVREDFSNYRSISRYREQWFQNGLLHRDNDLPAFIDTNYIINHHGREIHGYSCHVWYHYGEIYRDNELPSYIIYDQSGLINSQMWYQNNTIHRDNDLPASIDSDGSQKWYKYGKLHRDNDLPAIIYSNGIQEWYQNGLLHRDNDLPAIIYPNGTRKWYQNGELYRKNNLPCIVYPDGKKIWRRNGRFYDFAKYDCLIL